MRPKDTIAKIRDALFTAQSPSPILNSPFARDTFEAWRRRRMTSA